MSQELLWLKSHVGSIDDGIELINKLYWNISFHEREGVWFVTAGHKTLLRAESRDSVDAFLYGMSLAYSIMPEEFLKRLQEETGVE